MISGCASEGVDPAGLTPQQYAHQVCVILDDYGARLRPALQHLTAQAEATKTKKLEAIQSYVGTVDEGLVEMARRLRDTEDPAVDGGGAFHAHFVELVNDARAGVAGVRSDLADLGLPEALRALNDLQRAISKAVADIRDVAEIPPSVDEAVSSDPTCDRVGM